VKPLPIANGRDDCWNRIGVHGDRSCPELTQVGHCHNCPVFAAAGRRFLDTDPPAGYLEEWTARLAELEEDAAGELLSGLVFRMGDEWLALPVSVLVEVTPPRPVHRVPFRGGLLAGLVNVRGELHLAVRMDQLLGISRPVPPEQPEANGAGPRSGAGRLLVVRRGGDAWVFPVDEVDGVQRVPAADLAAVPPTLARASARFTRGVFRQEGRAVGYLDEARLFEALRTKVR
jgi:chemotaxis-related protein WspD